jgi:hypothetical protein
MSDVVAVVYERGIIRRSEGDPTEITALAVAV